MEKKPLGYLGGDIMTHGSNLARQYEYDKFIEEMAKLDEIILGKISDIEYLLLFLDIDKLDAIVRDIQNKVSTLVHYEFNYGDETIKTTNSIGIVYKNENISSSSDFMNALDNSLAEANTEGKEDGVSLYVAEKKEETKLTKENYSFDKIKVSLDNSFLDDDEI